MRLNKTFVSTYFGITMLTLTSLFGQAAQNPAAKTFTPYDSSTDVNAKPVEVTQASVTSTSNGPNANGPNANGPNAKGYVINFTNVGIIEYIRFISRISNTNFLFQDSDLQFTVTIVSEEPTSVDDIMAALIQILRIHGLSLLEQGNNLLIYKNADVAKLATVVSDQGETSSSPMITRVIRTTYVSPEKIKAIILPMLSSQAVVEVSPETRHLIITDLSANVEKVLQLLKSLDTPNTSMDVVTYFPQSGSSAGLLSIAEKILTPIALSENTTITLVQQPSTNTIFVVGSNDMTHRALSILQSLDQPGTGLDMPNTSVSVATYNAINMPASSLVSLAERILSPIASAEGIPFHLVLQPSTNAIFVTSTPGFNKRTIEVLTILDQPGASPESIVSDLPPDDIQRKNFFLYKLQYQNGEKIQDALNTIGQSMREDDQTNSDLANTINDVTWLSETNSLIFVGTELSLQKIRDVIREIDVPSRQVYVEVLVIRTSLQNSLNFGVQLGAIVQTKKGFSIGIGDFNPATTPSGFSNAFQVPPTIGTAAVPTIPMIGGFNLGSIGNFITHNGNVFGTLGALVTALQLESDTKIILNPKIIVEDNRKAQVFVGTNSPFTTTNVQIQAANNSTGFTVDYRDTGVLLQVTPLLGLSNMVTLEIHQEINEIDPTSNLFISGFPVPTTNKILTTTRVHVPSGYFIVLSGMIQNTKTYVRSGIPCLGCLPVIGSAFSQQAQSCVKDNIIIFLNPRIIDTPCQIARLTDAEGVDFYENSMPDSCFPEGQCCRYYNEAFGNSSFLPCPPEGPMMYCPPMQQR
ncbi:MAG: secretin N-terminal domain-containing protein [Chlamydiales bacterium]|nr:secretin N-terminal domain-containing protein [Chlamydiales bacterium]